MIGNKIDFVWEKSKTTESWTLPIMRSKITGAATMAGKKYSVEATKNAQQQSYIAITLAKYTLLAAIALSRYLKKLPKRMGELSSS